MCEEKKKQTLAQIRMNQKHATILASRWLDKRPHLPLHFFTPCPEGLKIGNMVIPGHYTDDL
jgi:hypothetical protein